MANGISNRNIIPTAIDIAAYSNHLKLRIECMALIKATFVMDLRVWCLPKMKNQFPYFHLNKLNYWTLSSRGDNDLRLACAVHAHLFGILFFHQKRMPKYSYKAIRIRLFLVCTTNVYYTVYGKITKFSVYACVRVRACACMKKECCFGMLSFYWNLIFSPSVAFVFVSIRVLPWPYSSWLINKHTNSNACSCRFEFSFYLLLLLSCWLIYAVARSLQIFSKCLP